MPTDNYAAYVDTPDGAVPIKDLSAQEQLQKKAPAIIETASGESILLTDSGDQALQGLNLYGKSEQVTTTGAQLLNYLSIEGSSVSGNATATIDDDGYINISGNGNNSVTRFNISPHIPVGEYTISIDNPIDITFGLTSDNGDYANGIGISIGNTSASKTTADEVTQLVFSTAGKEEFAYKLKIMLNAGTTALPWEPYTGGAPSPSPEYPQEIVSKAEDGNVTVTVTGGDADAQALTVSTPNGLPGIPVTSGGNYTDETGQQWVRDEVDFKRGVYVQRVKKYSITGNETIAKIPIQNVEGNIRYDIGVSSTNGRAKYSECLCSHYRYVQPNTGTGAWVNPDSNINEIGLRICDKEERFPDINSLKNFLQEAYSSGNPVTYLYALYIPEEINIAEDQVTAYAGLHTNYPTTTVVNDEGVYMSLDYAADTETYIANNYVDKATYNALEDRVAALEGAAVANV